MRGRLDIRGARRPVRYNCRGFPAAISIYCPCGQFDMRSLRSRVNGGRMQPAGTLIRSCRPNGGGGPRSGGRGTPSGGSIYVAQGAPFDIIAAYRRGNFDILPLRAIRYALASLARERGKEKRLSLFSSRSDISNDPGTGSYIESAEEGSPLRRLYRIARKPAQYLERAPRA